MYGWRMRRQAALIIAFAGLSACSLPRSRPVAEPPGPGPSAATSPGALPPPPPPSSASDDDPPDPCADPVEAAYLSDCQAGISTPDDGVHGDDTEEVDDGHEEETTVAPPSPSRPRPLHPFASLTDQQLAQRYKDDPGSVGSLSVGATNAGALINGVSMPHGDRWELLDPANAWGTQETIDALTRAIDKVYEKYPDSPKMQIGHISARNGGPLSPHVSHQSGRDVDVSYYVSTPTRWFTLVTDSNLDRARTWAFVRALLSETDVELILIDRRIQKMLREYATSIGESEAWLGAVFDGKPGVRPMIIHAKGHANHIHVRFYNPIAQETARRLQPLLGLRSKPPVPASYVLHRARSGDTLDSLARRYGTTVDAIRAANGLKSNAIKARRVYKIPRPGPARTSSPSGPSRPPPRRVPSAAHR
jgi:LysM repeat protein